MTSEWQRLVQRLADDILPAAVDSPTVVDVMGVSALLDERSLTVKTVEKFSADQVKFRDALCRWVARGENSDTSGDGDGSREDRRGSWRELEGATVREARQSAEAINRISWESLHSEVYSQAPVVSRFLYGISALYLSSAFFVEALLYHVLPTEHAQAIEHAHARHVGIDATDQGERRHDEEQELRSGNGSDDASLCDAAVAEAFRLTDMGLIMAGPCIDDDDDGSAHPASRDPLPPSSPSARAKVANPFAHLRVYRRLHKLVLLLQDLEQLLWASSCLRCRSTSSSLPRAVLARGPVRSSSAETEEAITRIVAKWKVATSTPEVHASSLSAARFLCEYYEQAKPVVIRGAAEHWPAFTKWKDPAYFRAVAGRRTVPVELGKAYTESSWTQKLMTVNDFLSQYYENPNPPIKGYLAQHQLFEQIPQLANDIATPDFALAGRSEESPVRMLWLGPAETVSPMHTDPYHNVFVQVVGVKYFRLHPPSETHLVAPFKSGLLQNTSSLPADLLPPPRTSEEGCDGNDEEAQRIAALPKTPPRCFEAVLRGGDALYLPCKWWHFVKSLTPSASISFWFDREESEECVNTNPKI